MTPAHAVRIVARGCLAGTACELLLTGLVLLLWRALHGEEVAEVWLQPAPTALLFALVAGLVAGGAWGVAEAVAGRVAGARRAIAAGAAAGLLVALVAPFAGDYALALRDTGAPADAAAAVVDALSSDLLAPLLLFASGALCLHVPLLAVRRGGEALGREVLAMSAGLVAWLVALTFVGGPFDAQNLSLYLALLLPRVVLFPLALRGADRLTALVSRKVRGEVVDAPRTHGARAQARTPDAVERHRARLLDARGRSHLEAARRADAVADLSEAHALWPTTDRALTLARAHAVALQTDAALGALEDAAALSEGRPAAFDGADVVWEPLRGHVRFDALVALVPARPVAGRRWRGAGLLAACWAATLAAGAVAPAALTPGETAEVTRLRVRAAVLGGDAWLDLARRLEAQAGAGEHGAWVPGALVRGGLEHPTPRDAGEAVADAYVRAAEAGSPEAMLAASSALGAYPHRQDEAAAWARRAAESGDPTGMWRWGTILRGGWFGLAPDDDAGCGWWARAAERGQADAMADLARWHARQDDVEGATRWFERAVRAGHDSAADERAALLGIAMEEP